MDEWEQWILSWTSGRPLTLSLRLLEKLLKYGLDGKAGTVVGPSGQWCKVWVEASNERSTVGVSSGSSPV